MRKKSVPYVLLLPQILLTILFMIGLVTGITQSLGVIPAFGLTEPTLKYYKEVFVRPEMAEALKYSLRVAFLSASIATVMGVFFCALLVMRKDKKKGMLQVIQLPIIVPHVVEALFIVNIFAQNGILARMAFAFGLIRDQQQFPMFLYHENGSGVILAYLWKEIPFVIYFVLALMENINGKLGEAAINLGAGRWTAFWKVTLPLCRRTIASGFLIIFVFALGAYELPFLLGATMPKALPVLAYQQYIHPDLKTRPYAMALNGIIILISLISAVVYFMMIQKKAGGSKDEK